MFPFRIKSAYGFDDPYRVGHQFVCKGSVKAVIAASHFLVFEDDPIERLSCPEITYTARCAERDFHFGFLFTETPAHDRAELDAIVRDDLLGYVIPEDHEEAPQAR